MNKIADIIFLNSCVTSNTIHGTRKPLFSKTENHNNDYYYSKKDIWNSIKKVYPGQKNKLKKIYNRKIDLLKDNHSMLIKKPDHVIREEVLIRLNNVLLYLKIHQQKQ
jgi:hypothetical protein